MLYLGGAGLRSYTQCDCCLARAFGRCWSLKSFRLLKFVKSWKVIGTLIHLPTSLTQSGRCRSEYLIVFLKTERESTRCTSWCHDWRCCSTAGLRPGLGEKIGIKPSPSSWHVFLCEFDMEFLASYRHDMNWAPGQHLFSCFLYHLFRVGKW